MGVVWIATAVLAGTMSLPTGVGMEQGLIDIEARIWTDRGEEPVVFRGDRVRLYYRTSADAYISILNISTDGSVRLVYPRSPDDQHYARAGRDYRLLFPRSEFWRVEDAPGMGYFFVVASPRPFDFSAFGYSRYDGGWDLSYVGNAVYTDPYQAIDDYVTYLLPDWEYADYAIDFATYHVDRRYEYPRFMCYECHGFRSYASWNPYHATCTSFTVVVYDDPYYYPGRRYRGDRVVFARPVQPFRARFEFKARARGESARVVVRTRAAADRDVTRPPARRARPRSEDARSRTAVPRSRGTTGVQPPRRSRDGVTPRTPVRVIRPPAQRPTDRARARVDGRGTQSTPTRMTRRSKTEQVRPPPREERQARPTLKRRDSGAAVRGGMTRANPGRATAPRAQVRRAPAQNSQSRARSSGSRTPARPPAARSRTTTRSRSSTPAKAKSPPRSRSRATGRASRPPRRGGSKKGSGGV